MNKDYELINFEEDHEMDYILANKYQKRKTVNNRNLLRVFGKKCKEQLGKKILTHKEFYSFLDERPDLLSKLD